MKTLIAVIVVVTACALAGCISYKKTTSHYDPITGEWVVDKSVGTPW